MADKKGIYFNHDRCVELGLDYFAEVGVIQLIDVSILLNIAFQLDDHNSEVVFDRVIVCIKKKIRNPRLKRDVMGPGWFTFDPLP